MFDHKLSIQWIQNKSSLIITYRYFFDTNYSLHLESIKYKTILLLVF